MHISVSKAPIDVLNFFCSNFLTLCCTCRAHRAANPEKYPIKERSKKLYPSLEGVESRFGPTPVHLQLYDGTSTQSRFLRPYSSVHVSIITKTRLISSRCSSHLPLRQSTAIVPSPCSAGTLLACRQSLRHHSRNTVLPTPARSAP